MGFLFVCLFVRAGSRCWHVFIRLWHKTQYLKSLLYNP